MSEYLDLEPAPSFPDWKPGRNLTPEEVQAIRSIADKGDDPDIDMLTLNVVPWLVARIAELEAAQKPIPFSEREPEDYQEVLIFYPPRGDWYIWRWHRGEHALDDFRAGRMSHWLPMPPAPEAQP